MRIAPCLAALTLLAACGGGGSAPPPPPPPPPPSQANRPPVFTSPTSVQVPENTATAFYQASATDADGNALTYEIAGGPHAASFTITSAGALSFVAPPDYERGPTVLTVQLSVSDGTESAILTLTVSVVDIAGEGFTVFVSSTGTSQPLFVTGVPGLDRYTESNLFVVTKGGQVILLGDREVGRITYLDLSSEVSTDGERGLLGLATAPDFATSGLIYVYLTNKLGDIEIRRYGRQRFANGNFANAADPASGNVILTIPHRQFNNHNGGWLGFGPDNLLYIATGDGGGTGDPLNNAQNLGSLLGKILRIDPTSDAFPDDPNRDYSVPSDNRFPGAAATEVYAYGLRNPFRASFDGANLLIGDVGQGAIEEVNLLRPQDKGFNFGWPFMEGTRPYRGTAPTGLIPPVTEYEHGTGPTQGRSITGGYVYRGASRALQGLYIFGDFVSGNIWSIPAAEFVQGATVPSSRYTLRTELMRFGTLNPGSIAQPVSFGLDARNNLYVLDFSDGQLLMVQASN